MLPSLVNRRLPRSFWVGSWNVMRMIALQHVYIRYEEDLPRSNQGCILTSVYLPLSAVLRFAASRCYTGTGMETQNHGLCHALLDTGTYNLYIYLLYLLIILWSLLNQVLREYTTKVDKLEQNEAQREKEDDTTEHKNIIQMEPQLMITAGPAMGIPPQYATNYPPGAAAAAAAAAGRNMGYPYM